MLNPFRRRDKHASSSDCAEKQLRRSNLFHRRRREVALLTPNDIVVVRIVQSLKSPIEYRRQRRREGS
ncbi:uncharacterized protein PHALS_14954 [Plasmopara halstedii]|uniref:Uncharacterized protein n=1 Tax=Plasmopara halstedii TaxID=4781 RepID=A0A0P1AXL4_PLAHL|nr:uncharacterized protein PHALS_14954 [Plasmopara halstedii]CEG47016.1 hypothetical protein PHALS_14954 [Plasmopara halstedii]|eukprot:XP_024583385.1 hypothetical protein PHALS_14954 [Plasmopara halstedii]